MEVARAVRPPSGAIPVAQLEALEEGKPEKAIEIVFLDSLPADLQCRLCSQVLRLPQKLACGHKICLDCVKGQTACPECGGSVDASMLKLDKPAQKQIQALAVRCTFFDNGCAWQGRLHDLESHVLMCEKADMSCPNDCGAVFARPETEKHLAEECPKRNVRCQHCGYTVTAKGLKMHHKVCPSFPTDCPHACGLTGRSRREIEGHVQVCPKALQGSVCPFSEFGCAFHGDRETLQKHIKDQPVRHLSFLCDGVLDLKSALTAVQLNSERLAREMGSLTARIESLEKLYGAQFIWRIDNMRLRQNEARSGAKPTIFSPPFLSGRHGYKLVLSAALFGDGAAHGQHLSVFIAVMRGEFDALLTWPFVHKVTLTLMDQNPVVGEREHVVHVLKPRASVEGHAFLERPISDRNASFGAQKFCHLDELDKFIRDDVMFIKCNVDVENMVVL